jgi:hypothetical protein
MTMFAFYDNTIKIIVMATSIDFINILDIL